MVVGEDAFESQGHCSNEISGNRISTPRSFDMHRGCMEEMMIVMIVLYLD